MDRQDMIEFYSNKLERKQNILLRLQAKNNDLNQELEINETIYLNVLQAEVRLLNEILEDLI